MTENQIEITQQQFEKLTSLPAVKETYSFYINKETFVEMGAQTGHKLVYGMRFAGVNFIVN